MQKKFLLSILILLCVSSGFSGSISVNPSYMHFGEIQRGTTETVEIYVSTRGYNQSFDVKPKYGDALTSSVFEGLGPIKPDSVSQENIASWVRFPKGTYTITPSTSRDVEVGGETIRADGTIKMTIVVPQDGEPGYHAGSIDLNPVLGNSEQGYGTSVRAQTFAQFSFKVPGEANRNIEVTNVEVLRTGENQATLRTYVKNYGDVTTRVKGGELKILTMNGRQLTKVDATGKMVPPGKTAMVKSFWKGDLEGGRYQVSGSLNYMTGKATLSESFSLPQKIEITDAQDRQTNQTRNNQGEVNKDVPLWLVIIALVVIGVLMYSFEVDPVWILGVLGFIGIATFIVMSSISNIYLAGLLISGGLLAYYGVM